MSARRAKIVCTIGPATDSREALRALVDAGMDVARLNYSHGTHEGHAHVAALVREASAAAGRPVALLQDLCGPKIRTATVGPARVTSGETIALRAGDAGDAGTIAVDYAAVAEELKPGDAILLGDGRVELRVLGRRGDRLECHVQHGGELRAKMGVNLPSGRLRLDALTAKDERDLEHGLAIGVDYVALSFVKSAVDIASLKARIARLGAVVPVIAKIETPAAVGAIEAIVAASDAVMVARGDLGVELPPETVPVLQKRIIEACRTERRPVIVATEMLQSMVAAPRPTRAEASDVAGAVFDGADAVMLSAETATGQYPELACQMMDRIVREAEASRFHAPVVEAPSAGTPDAIAYAACRVAREIGARVVVALTQNGGTARLVSAARPLTPVIGVSPDPRTLRRLCLYWGISPRFFDVATDIDDLVRRTRALLVGAGLVASGERYVIVYGAPLGESGSTNALRVEEVP
ncbi:MAG: pyruvate kinase [Sorangiineae bacterium]|nr:pyruvate kinase [Polyangiaceae bacterium]MEB2323098.1 pyruvate kinase [Sorangiineae bacterium]